MKFETVRVPIAFKLDTIAAGADALTVFADIASIIAAEKGTIIAV